MPSTVSGRYSTLGYGPKTDAIKIVGKDAPPATKYTLESQFEESKRKGRTFGASHDTYRKVHAKGVTANQD